MAGIGETTRRIAGAQVRTPKTILGFFAIVLGILATGAALVIGALAGEPALHKLIAPILLFVAALIVIVLVGVFVTAWKDPTILMLGEVSGEAFIENRRLSLGDSIRGEQIEEIKLEVPCAGQPALPPGEDVGGEQNQ